MIDITIFIITLLILLALAVAAAWLLRTSTAATEKVRMQQLRIDELKSTVKKLTNELRELDDLKDSLDRDKAALTTRLEAVTRTRE